MDTAVIVALVASIASFVIALLNLGSAVAVRKRVLAVEDQAKKTETVRNKVMSSAEELVSCLDKLKHEIGNLDFLIEHQVNTEDALKEALMDIGKAKGAVVAKLPLARLYWPEESIDRIEQVLSRLGSVPMDRKSLGELFEFVEKQQISIAKEFRSRYVDH